MKKLLLLLLCLTLAASCLIMTACGEDPCTAHADADGNGKCDECGADVEPEPCTEHTDADGDYLCDDCGAAVLPEGPTQVDVTFTVKDDEGDLLAGVTVILANGEDEQYNVTTAASDANGKITAKVYTGTYGVYYDYDVDTLGYYISETTGITVSADTTAMELLLVDNTPNGTLERPYTISAGENTLSVPAGASHNYIIYRAVNLFFSATDAAGIKVTYNDVEYTADNDGKIYFPLLGTDTNSVEQLVISNTTAADISCALDINSAPGTYSNPIVIENAGETVTTAPLGDDDIVYYTYTATVSGVFTLKLDTDGAYASMLNTSNSTGVNSASDAINGVIALQVNAGDVIMIDISSAATGDDTAAVTFTPEISEPTAW